jgi:hypothetical protein
MGVGYKVGQFDGILGLAFDTLAVCDYPYVPDCVPTPFHRMIEAGMLDAPVFSFYLGDLKVTITRNKTLFWLAKPLKRLSPT